MLWRGIPEHIRSDNGPEFLARDLRQWLGNLGAGTLYIEPGSPLVDREAAFLAELEDRQLLVGEVLRTSGDAEVSDGFQGGVQEKVKWGLFRSVKDYSIRNIV